MALSLVGILSVDPETETITKGNLKGQYWLVVKETDADYRALGLDAEGTFFGDVQQVSEDDLLEGYMLELAFFKDRLGNPLKKISELLAQKEQSLREDLKPIIAAMTALIQNKEYKIDLKPSQDDLSIMNRMLKDFDSIKPELSFICALASMAILHRKNQNYEQAIFYYLKALDIGGEDPNILFNMARAYHEMGATSRAKNSLERALKLDPKMSMARKFLEFLS